jgi:hypothetical protein
MGASNVAAVYARWTGLNHVPFRLLAYMALVSLDRDEPPRFWGGRDDLAGAIGRTLPREPDDTDTDPSAVAARRQRRAAHEAVRAGLRELKDVGAITTAKHARQGLRAEYLLHLSQPQDQPAPVAQDQPVPRTGSACVEAQTHPGPE